MQWYQLVHADHAAGRHADDGRGAMSAAAFVAGTALLADLGEWPGQPRSVRLA